MATVSGRKTGTAGKKKTYALEGSFQPQSWDQIIGQDKAKRQLQMAARAAKLRGVPMAHCLIESGMQGIGKTTLALLTADELGARIKVVSGKIRMEEARVMFASMKDGDVLLLEECHQLVTSNKRDIEWLLHYLENGVTLGPRGPEEQPKVTIIGTTTDASKLPATILDRLRIKPEIVAYTDLQAAKIAAVMSASIMAGLTQPTPANLANIARAGNNNPRVIRGLLETLRDSVVVGMVEFKKRVGYDLELLLDDAGLTPDGLTASAQKYLKVLYEYQGTPAGEGAIKNRIREASLEHVERILVDKDLIVFTTRGRTLTRQGIVRAQELLGID